MDLFSGEATGKQLAKVYHLGLEKKSPYWNFGYPILTQCVCDLESGLWFIVAPENVGKCYNGDMLLADGSYKHVSKVVPGDIAMTLGKRSLEPRRVLRKVYSGSKPVYRVTLYDGSEVVATAEHPFLTRHGWRPLGQLFVGAEVGVPNSLPCGTHVRDPKELRLLGYLLGDGGVSNGNVCFTNINSEIVDDFVSCLPDGYELVLHYHKNPHHYRVRAVDNADYGGPGRKGRLRLWCEEVGLWGCRAWEKRLPDWVFCLNEEGLIEVLRGLFATDAYLPKSREIEYCSTSRELAYGVKRLLLRLGVRARITQRSSNHGRDNYRVYIGAKGSQIDILWAKLRVPGKSEGEHPCVQWFEITRIVPEGEQDVWDVEIEGTHNFIGGEDIFLHNSQFQVNLGYNVLRCNDDTYWLDFMLDNNTSNRLSYLLACAGDLPISLVTCAGEAPDKEKEIRKQAFQQFHNKYKGRYHLIAEDRDADYTVNIFDVSVIAMLIGEARMMIGENAKLFVTVDGFHDVIASAAGSEETMQQKQKSQILKKASTKFNALICCTTHTRKDSRKRNMTSDIMKGEDTPAFDAMVISHLYSDVNHNREMADVWWTSDEFPGQKLPVHELDILKNKGGPEKKVIFFNHYPGKCFDWEVDQDTQDLYRAMIFKTVKKK